MAVTMVTGATGGIGTAVVRRFRARGDDIIAVGRNPESVKALDARPVVVDLAVPGSIAAAIDALGLQSLDVLVYCAGVIELGAVADTRPETWSEHLTVNLVAAAEVIRCVLPALRRAGGHVVLINYNGYGHVAPGWGPYAASKEGLRSLADVLRAEEERHGVKVTSVYPACTATEMQRGIREGHGRRYRPDAYVQPDSLAGLVLAAVESPSDARVTDVTVSMASPSAAVR